ncbi:hypothetical protein BD626DRAFT_568535 [Schizophyllum amplum]|uniref:Uncharacterized protein n=1 Tax=Schizophyllum amplum TaxID=97359 RepID=A0A550CGK7_9AGAR|nr:hypothetical protein BD626DRAFT_568535 [Auriculariopsis ampla]
MAPKRPAANEESSTARKRAKTSAARTIRIQEPSAQAGPSTVTLDSMKKLPGAIQVEKFAEARAFEINAMHTAMENSSCGSESSSLVPRSSSAVSTRRNAPGRRFRVTSVVVPQVMIHAAFLRVYENVPKLKSTDPSQAPPQGEEGTNTANVFAKRQRDKTWLETHKGITQKNTTTTTPQHRTLWLRCHADGFDAVFRTLHRAIVFAQDEYNKANPDSAHPTHAGSAYSTHAGSAYSKHARTEPEDVEIADLRGEVNVFEIMGPQANQFWASLQNLQTSAAVPRGMVVGFEVDDPRLRFPPKRAKSDDAAALSQTPTFPSPALRLCDLGCGRAQAAVGPENLIPGTPLNALRQDDRVPVLLVQKSVEATSSSSSSASSFNTSFPSTTSAPAITAGRSSSPPAGAWLPRLARAHGHPCGGQRERAAQAFEAGVACFPAGLPWHVD